jgi:hypothetical protein
MTDKHAENKRLYAIDAEKNLRPFLLWIFRNRPEGGWISCTSAPTWSDSSEYKRIDEAPDYPENEAEQQDVYTGHYDHTATRADIREILKEPSIEETLLERGNRYGDFKEHARITQNIKRAMVDSPNWSGLSDDKKECFEMIAHKIGRVLNGSADYIDSWFDICGYATLVVRGLEKEQGIGN